MLLIVLSVVEFLAGKAGVVSHILLIGLPVAEFGAGKVGVVSPTTVAALWVDATSLRLPSSCD